MGRGGEIGIAHTHIDDVFAGVPAPGFWAFLVLIVAIIQLPPIIVLGPMLALVAVPMLDNRYCAVPPRWNTVAAGSHPAA